MSSGEEGIRLHAYASGRVQGVFYRMFVLQEARGLGLTGLTRNLPDGRVEVIAEGPRVKLSLLVNRLRQGPPAASVEDVTQEWGTALGEFTSFEVDYG